MNKLMPIYENGFQVHKYDNPQFPIYIRKSSLKIIDYSYRMHWHNEWEIVLVTNGKMKFYVDNEIVSLNQNEAIFINSNRQHYGFSDNRENSEYICLVVSPAMFVSNPYVKEKYVDVIENDENHPYLLIAEKHQINIIYSMYETAQKQDMELQFQVLLYSLLVELYHIYLNSPKRQLLKVNNYFMQLMLSFVATHYQEKITLNDLSKVGKVSKNTCINIFKSKVGVTPLQFVNSFRLQHSMDLLINTDMSVTDICFECGFNSNSFYAMQFKKLTDLTPLQFRGKK